MNRKLALALYIATVMLVGVLVGCDRAPRVTWVGSEIIPHAECKKPGYTVYANEREALEGKPNYVHCVKEIQ